MWFNCLLLVLHFSMCINSFCLSTYVLLKYSVGQRWTRKEGGSERRLSKIAWKIPSWFVHRCGQPNSPAPHFQRRQSVASKTITKTIYLSILPHSKHVTHSGQNLLNIARRREVFLYSLQHNGFAHIAVQNIEMYHLQSGPTGRIIKVR